MKRIRAYSFHAGLRLAEIRDRFNQLGPWQWIDRESERFGDYISTRALPDPDQGMIKVFVEREAFAVSVNLSAEPGELEAVYDTLFTHLMPAIGATGFAETDPYE